MRELTIGKNDAGQRVDRFVSKALPLLPPALLQKYIRLKRIKVNGGRAQRDQRLREGGRAAIIHQRRVSSTSPGRIICSSPCSAPVWISSTRTRI